MRRTVAAVVLAVVALSACTGAREATGSPVAGVRSGVLLPAVADREALPDVGSRPLVADPDTTASLTDLAGRVGVVNFWASWCGPCRAEQPALNEAAERLADLPVAFLGVNFRNDPLANAVAHQREFDVPYPSLYDPDNGLAAALGVPVIPATVFLDADGNVAGRLLGETDADEVVAFAERLAVEAGG